MGQELQVFSTRGIPGPHKAAHWNTILGEFVDRFQVQPSDPLHFDGTLVRQRVGPIAVFFVRCSSVHIWHKGEISGRIKCPSYQLLMPVQGGFTIAHGNKPATAVAAGSLLLIDRAERYEIAHGDGLRMIGVEFPRAMLEHCLPHASMYTGTVAYPDCGAMRVLGGLLRTLDTELNMGGPAGSLPPAMARSIAGLVAAAFSVQTRPTMQRGMKSRINAYREYVASRQDDGDLRPLHVAREFNVSERYVRMVFQSSGEPFSAFLIRLRHERAASMLRSSHCATRTIMEIALECGFNSASHFGQGFRQRFGVTPSEYRLSTGIDGRARKAG